MRLKTPPARDLLAPCAQSLPHLGVKVPGAVLGTSLAELSALCTCTPTDLRRDGRRETRRLSKRKGRLGHAGGAALA